MKRILAQIGTRLHVLKSQSPEWSYWQTVEPFRYGAYWEALRTWGMLQRRIVESCPLSLLPFLLAIRGAVLL